MEQSVSYLCWCNERSHQRATGSLRHQVGGHWTACIGGGPASSSDRAGFVHYRRKLGTNILRHFVSSHRKWNPRLFRLSCWMRDVERRAPQPRRHLLRGSFAPLISTEKKVTEMLQCFPTETVRATMLDIKSSCGGYDPKGIGKKGHDGKGKSKGKSCGKNRTGFGTGSAGTRPHKPMPTLMCRCLRCGSREHKTAS